MSTETEDNHMDVIDDSREMDRLLLKEPPEVAFKIPTMDESKYQVSTDRFESQDDLVDEYDSHVTSPRCLATLTFCERVLTFLVIVLLIVVIALTVAFVKTSHPAPQEQVLCTTTECVMASSAILQAMDNTTSPCIDFYQYACGGWTGSTPLPKGKHSWDRFQELADHTYYTLEKLLEGNGHTPYNEAERKAQRFFRSCMASMNHPKENYRHRMRDLLHKLGAWGSASPDVSEQLTLVHRLGVFPLFSFAVIMDPENPHKNIIKIGAPTFSIDARYLQMPRHNVSKHEIAEYRKQMINIRVVLDGENSTNNRRRKVEQEVDDVIELMSILAQASASFSSAENSFKFRKYNISELEHAFPLKFNHNITGKGFSWPSYVRSFWPTGRAPPSSNRITVFADDGVYLQTLVDVLANYSRRPRDTQTIHNYVAWSLMSTLSQYVGPHLFHDYGQEGYSEWKRCIFYTNQAFSFATGALYLKNNFHKSYVQEVHILIKYIKEAFKDYLLQKFWMDDQTRKLAAEKIDAIIDRVSYGSVLMNDTFLDNFYANLSVTEGDWFTNVISWRHFHIYDVIERLGQRPNRESWLSAPVTVNTLYSPERNDLFFPAAVFQPPFFSPGWPQAMNFGALGAIIGHEITHAFDNLGRQFGKDGKLGNWWGNITADGYARAVPCMRRQYSGYSLRGYAVNGSRTTSENVADNGGMRAALLGYRLWKLTTTERRVLPGIELTGDQLFYVSFAQTYCAKYTDAGAFLVTSDTHSPHPIRVRGVIMNSEAFSHVYRCGLHATMNARIKCIVW